MQVAKAVLQDEVLSQIIAVLDGAEPDVDPAKQIQAVGRALTEIGTVLEGRSLDECRRIIRASKIILFG